MVLDDVYVDAVMGISAYDRTTISTPRLARCPASLLEWLDDKDDDDRSTSNENDPAQKHQQLSSDDDGHNGLRSPILTGLAAAMQGERCAVLLAANNGLLKVLTHHGGRFSPSMWTLVFRVVISPISDDVRHLCANTGDSVKTAKS